MTDRDPPDLALHKAHKAEEAMVDMRRSMAMFQQNMPAILEYQKLMAEVRFKKFEALKAAGFTDAQAIELCKGMDIA